jgi:acyl carrier protein
MADSVEDRVRTIVAEELHAAPQNVRPETVLRLGDLGSLADLSGGWQSAGWAKLYAIADRIERDYGIRFDLGTADLWTTVADIIASTETAIARAAALAAARRGRAA